MPNNGKSRTLCDFGTKPLHITSSPYENIIELIMGPKFVPRPIHITSGWQHYID